MTRRPLWPYLYWAFVGVLIGYGVVGILSIGIFVLAAALILTILGVAMQRARMSAMLAIIPGLGVLPLWVASNNWGGPGELCGTSATGQYCNELLDPWPFGIFGAIVLVGGIALVWLVATQEIAATSGSRP